MSIKFELHSDMVNLQGVLVVVTNEGLVSY